MFPKRRSKEKQYGIYSRTIPQTNLDFYMFDEIHLLELAPTSLVRGLLEDDNLSTLKTIHILTGQILFGQGDLSYPMNWEDLHRIIEVRSQDSNRYAISLTKITVVGDPHR